MAPRGRGPDMLEDRCDYFILAYDSPSFSAAAAKVPMSPQGFAKAIHNLERDLGVPLFVLGDDGVRRPTPYAEEFYEYARHMQAERNLLAGAFERIAKSGYLEIRIASSLGVFGMLGPDFLDGFKRERPDASVAINELPDSSCESLLRDGLYDLALTTLPSPDDFQTVPLYSSPVQYWVHRDDPLSGQDSLKLADLSGRRVAIPGREYKCHHALIATPSRFARRMRARGRRPSRAGGVLRDILDLRVRPKGRMPGVLPSPPGEARRVRGGEGASGAS